METPKSIRLSLEQGEWVTLQAFSNAYFHIHINPRPQILPDKSTNQGFLSPGHPDPIGPETGFGLGGESLKVGCTADTSLKSSDCTSGCFIVLYRYINAIKLKTLNKIFLH